MARVLAASANVNAPEDANEMPFQVTGASRSAVPPAVKAAVSVSP
jgi:hypothetical protein